MNSIVLWMRLSGDRTGTLSFGRLRQLRLQWILENISPMN